MPFHLFLSTLAASLLHDAPFFRFTKLVFSLVRKSPLSTNSNFSVTCNLLRFLIHFYFDHERRCRRARSAEGRKSMFVIIFLYTCRSTCILHHTHTRSLLAPVPLISHSFALTQNGLPFFLLTRIEFNLICSMVMSWWHCVWQIQFVCVCVVCASMRVLCDACKASLRPCPVFLHRSRSNELELVYRKNFPTLWHFFVQLCVVCIRVTLTLVTRAPHSSTNYLHREAFEFYMHVRRKSYACEYAGV